MTKSLAPLMILAAFAACDVPLDHFEPNELRGVTLASARRLDSIGSATADAASVVEAWFGTPENPSWPSFSDPEGLVDADRLMIAAGAVSSDRDGRHRGLYREHCVVCHGLEGQGSGPAALFQNPYPRNLRHGIFKWKSTRRDAKPTRDDLRRVLAEGLPGSSMPDFSAVDEAEREALVDYVIYLSARGEIERALIAAAVDELGYGEETLEPDWRLAAEGETEGGQLAREIATDVLNAWRNAESEIVAVPPMPKLDGEALVESVERGRTLFHGQAAACAGCHGKEAAGDAVLLDYDDWTKDYSSRVGIDPTDRDAIKPLKKLGALTPRLADPRNLRLGVYRGGGGDDDLYRRLTQGIAGSPMPGVLMQNDSSGVGLREDEVWDLIRYLRSLPAAGSANNPPSSVSVPETDAKPS